MIERRICTRRALPLLWPRDGKCPDCGILLTHWTQSRHGYRPDGTGAYTLEPGYESAEVDHLTPRSFGGLNVLSNMEVVCGPCNRARYREWMQSEKEARA